AALAIMSAISFVAIAHLWPWYLVWTVLIAALVPRWWLARFVIGVSVLAAFSLSFWWVEPIENSREWASLVLYVGAVLWCLLTRPPPLKRVPARSPAEIAGGSFERPGGAGCRPGGSRLGSAPP